MTGECFALLVNRGSGPDDDAADVTVAAVREAGLAHEVHAIEGDPAAAARRAVADGATVLVACGGDGSVGAIAGVAAEAGVPLGVVPTGTLNHFARDLGLPTDPAEAVTVLARGVRRQVDLGRVGDTPFVNNASVGTYARLVARRERIEDRLGKWRAALVALRTVFPQRPTPVEVAVDGERIATEATLVFFGNNEYVVEEGRFTRERLDAGVVSVFVLRAPHLWDLVRIAFRIARGTVARERSVIARSGAHVRFTAPRDQVLLAHDGEVELVTTPLEVTVEHRALTVLAPS